MQLTPFAHKNSSSEQGDGTVGGIVPVGNGVSKNTHPGVKEMSSTAISPSCPSPTSPSIKI